MVSIIIPTFNYGKYLTETIQSVKNQSYSNWECIIVDDGSTDNTKEIVEDIIKSDTRFKYIYQNNKGVSAARNAGIKLAKGKFIQFLDGDDLLQIHKIRSQIEVFEKNPEIDIVYNPVRFFDDGNSQQLRVSKKADKLNDWIPQLSTKGKKVVAHFIKLNFLVMNAPLVRMNVFDTVGYFDERMKAIEDWDFWTRCALANCYFHFHIEENSFALVRIHHGSLSTETKLMNNGHFIFLQHSLSHKNISKYHTLLLFAKYVELFWDSIFSKTKFEINSTSGAFISVCMLPVYVFIKSIRLIKTHITDSEFSKSLLTLISGTTVAQAISVAASPILSRIYTPSEFGVFGTFSSIIGLLCLFSGFRYEGSVLLPKDDGDAANLLVLSLFFNFITSFLLLLMIVCLSFFISSTITDSELFKWIYLSPIFIFFMGVAQSLNCWYNRRKKYREIINYRITNSGINNVSSVTLGYSKIAVNGLLTSYFITNIISAGFFIHRTKHDYYQFKNTISKKRMIFLAKKYRRFPLVNSFQALFESLQLNGIIYFVSYFFDKVIVGVYSFSMRVLMVPMNFAGAAMSQIFYQHASETYNNNGDLKQLMKNTMIKSIIIVIPILLLLILFGPQAFSFIFGSKWYNAGVYARILAPWVLLDFIRAPLSQVPIIVGKQNRLLQFSFFSNVIVFGTMLYSGMIMQDIKTGLLLLSIFQSLYTIAIIIWIFKIVNHSSENSKNHFKQII